VRLTLLEKYGGVWFDASVICTNPVESWCDSSEAEGKLTMFPMHANPNIHGNWAMAVNKTGHPLVRAWRAELSTVFNQTGTGQLPTSYADQSFASHPDLVDLWNKPSPPPLPYLWVYLALQVVLQQRPELRSTINLLPRIDGPMYRRYKLNVEQGIVDSLELSEATAVDLANQPLCPSSHDRYFIKLVGKDRGPCQVRLDDGSFEVGSPLDYLRSMPPRAIVYGKDLQERLARHSRLRVAVHTVLATRYITKSLGMPASNDESVSQRLSFKTDQLPVCRESVAKAA